MENTTNLDSIITTTSVMKETHAPKTSCLRCGGFLVGEHCTDSLETHRNSWFWATRCIQCGDVVDEVTLRNRAKSLPTQIIDVVDPFERIHNAMEHAT